ncbi:MAG TPA: hypothetical protein VMH87_17940 [Pseudomonadales bacterium]|nr:hypothetical protein [Pseudomonadales bacterium]
MRPAFSSTRQAAGFVLLLLALLLAPALAGKKILPSREAIYSSIWWENGDFPYMDGEIFREKSDLDIVFMGSSHIWAAFDAPYVQDQLGKQLGRPAVVRTFGWGGAGYDEIYFVAQDLLEHRRVRLLVIDDDFNESDQPHMLAPRMFRFGDNALALDGLSPSVQAAYYFGSIMGLPRNLLALVHTNLPADMNATNYWQTRSHAVNFADNLGAFTARAGYRITPASEPDPFVNYTPDTGVQPSAVCIGSPATQTNFLFFENRRFPPFTQLHFIQKLDELALKHGCKLVVVHIPTFEERRATYISMPEAWHRLQPNVTTVGIAPATLFQGLTDDQIRELYSDDVHLNENGQKYFTTVMTPTLLKLYESQNP